MKRTRKSEQNESKVLVWICIMTEQALLQGGFALHRVLLCSPHTDRLVNWHLAAMYDNIK